MAANCFAFSVVVGDAERLVGVVADADEAEGKRATWGGDGSGAGGVGVEGAELDFHRVDEGTQVENLVVELDGW